MAGPLYDAWDIVKVPFPFTEGTGDKRRPALIVSGAPLATHHRLYWLVMITSVVRPAWKGDVAIADFHGAGLPVASIVRTAKIATLQEDKILGRIGSLGSKERRQVAKAMKQWFEE